MICCNILVQQVWGKTVTVAACDSNDEPFQLRFKYLEIVGNGTFGIVCRAQNMDTQEIIAIKTVFQDEGHQVPSVGHGNMHSRTASSASSRRCETQTLSA